MTLKTTDLATDRNLTLRLLWTERMTFQRVKTTLTLSSLEKWSWLRTTKWCWTIASADLNKLKNSKLRRSPRFTATQHNLPKTSTRALSTDRETLHKVCGTPKTAQEFSPQKLKCAGPSKTIWPRTLTWSALLTFEHSIETSTVTVLNTRTNQVTQLWVNWCTVKQQNYAGHVSTNSYFYTCIF